MQCRATRHEGKARPKRSPWQRSQSTSAARNCRKASMRNGYSCKNPFESAGYHSIDLSIRQSVARPSMQGERADLGIIETS